MTDWARVKHFTSGEFPKDPTRVLPETIYLLDEMRDAAGVPFIVHVAWDSDGHVENSGHYGDVATAVDFHMVGWTLLDQWLFAERFPWHGIGCYPFWNQPGLHCDLKTGAPEHPNLGRRWWRDQSGVYLPLNRQLLSILNTQ